MAKLEQMLKLMEFLKSEPPGIFYVDNDSSDDELSFDKDLCWYCQGLPITNALVYPLCVECAVYNQDARWLYANDHCYPFVSHGVFMRQKDTTMRVILRDGDTPDWTRLEFSFDTRFVNLIKWAVQGTDRNFDFRRKVWFVHNDVVDSLMNATKAMYKGLDIEFQAQDKRTKAEAFEEFFNQVPAPAPVPKSKAELLQQLELLLKKNQILISVREDIQVNDAKKIYRQAAMQFHPDRNNGDASRMTELNVIWAQLQTML